MKKEKNNFFAFSAVILNLCFSVLWSFWGILENFHEGWYYSDILENLALFLFQYLLFAIIFILLGLFSIRYHKAGAILYIITAILIPVLKIKSFSAIFVFSIPLFIIGLLFWFSDFKNKKWFYLFTVLIPLSVIIVFAVEPVIRLSQRIDKYDKNAVLVEGNEVELIWAPEGPGWITETGQIGKMKWKDAKARCERLSDDGKYLCDSAQYIWRLPSVNEAVRSLSRHAVNCGGVWDSISKKPVYKIMPDKESPLWKVKSPVIYWWTATELNDSMAFRIVYNGSVQVLNKKITMGSLGFRAVKNIKIKNIDYKH